MGVERTTVTVKMDNTDKYTSYTIHSRNHQFSLEFQDDGNLVLYDLSRYRLPMGGVLHDKYISRRSVWSTDTIHKEYCLSSDSSCFPRGRKPCTVRRKSRDSMGFWYNDERW